MCIQCHVLIYFCRDILCDLPHVLSKRYAICLIPSNLQAVHHTLSMFTLTQQGFAASLVNSIHTRGGRPVTYFIDDITLTVCGNDLR